MKNATLKIYGDIGESLPIYVLDTTVENENTSASIVSQFLDDNKDATEITVRINSRGGDVQEGWAIHDLLVNSGKKITTIGEGKVYSIATIIFLAGSDRLIMQNADGLIHNPYIPEYTLADKYESDDLLKIAESLKQEEAKILDFYVSKTGSSSDKLAKLMEDDTKMSSQDMLDLGFATKIIEPVKAYAYIKPINKFKMEEKDVKTFGDKIDAILAKLQNLTRLPSKDQTITAKDGKEFKLDKETGNAAVGDKASPDGSFVMADGSTVVIAGGVVTEVKQPVVGKTELEIANEKIAALEAQLAAAAKEKPDLVAAEAAWKAKQDQAVALATELHNLKNSWKPESRTRQSAAEKVGDIDMNRVREINKKLNNKTE